MSDRAWLVIVAAGKGSRLGHASPKAVVPIAGRPMIAYSLEAAAGCAALEGVVVVGDETAITRALADEPSAVREAVRLLVPGGATRQRSVRAGLDAVRELVREEASEDPVVLVHDAARPFAGAALFTLVAEAARTGPVVSAGSVVDTIKRIEGERIVETLDRASLVRAQTPQAARLSLLLRAHESAGDDGSGDDAILLERIGETVRVLPGPEWNFKITTPEDLRLAEAWLATGALTPDTSN